MSYLLFCGDYCPRLRVENFIQKKDYSTVFSSVYKVIEESDFSIVNLESPLTIEKKGIRKNGPNLKCSENGIEALKWAGFDAVTLANNHFFDYGQEGVLQTIKCCDNFGLDFVGGGKDVAEAGRILFVEVNEVSISIINCCEHEFSIAVREKGGSNPINPISQFYSITEAKKKSDLCFVIVHGGIEHYQLPTPRMQDYCRFLIDVGADAVICHHQHCYSGYELYGEAPIFYGLGNFCFDGNRANGNKSWNEGYMVKLEVTERKISGFELVPYIQCSDCPSVKLMEGKDKEQFYVAIEKLNRIISDRQRLETIYNNFIMDISPVYEDALSPYTNRFLRSLRRRGIIPSFLSEARVLKLKNYIECESHRDNLIEVLNRIITKWQ